MTGPGTSSTSRSIHAEDDARDRNSEQLAKLQRLVGDMMDRDTQQVSPTRHNIQMRSPRHFSLSRPYGAGNVRYQPDADAESSQPGLYAGMASERGLSSSNASSVSLTPRDQEPSEALQAKMKGLQGRVTTLNKHISDLYHQAEYGLDGKSPSSSSVAEAAAPSSSAMFLGAGHSLPLSAHPYSSTEHLGHTRTTAVPSAATSRTFSPSAHYSSQQHLHHALSGGNPYPGGSGMPTSPGRAPFPSAPPAGGPGHGSMQYRGGTVGAHAGGVMDTPHPMTAGGGSTAIHANSTAAAMSAHLSALGLGDVSRGPYGRDPGGYGGGLQVTGRAGSQGDTVGQREEERLRSWLQEMRHERRRLEDRLMGIDELGSKRQDIRDDLEKQVASMSIQRDVLEAEMGSMVHATQQIHALTLEVAQLLQALHNEKEKTKRHRDLRSVFETQIGEVGEQLSLIMEHHTKVASELQQDRDSFATKFKRAARRQATAEMEVQKLRSEVELLHAELQERDVAFAEVKASAEMLQNASTQMTEQASLSHKELEARIADAQDRNKLLLHANYELKRDLEESEHTAEVSMHQIKELRGRCDFLRTEREKLLKLLKTEQHHVASTKLGTDSLHKQLGEAEQQKIDLDSSARSQLELLRQRHEGAMREAHVQFESAMASQKKQYTALQRQYEGALANQDKVLEAHSGLRLERDEVWAEGDRLKADIAILSQERDELSAKLNALRNEVKHTMDDVVRDRDQRLRDQAGQNNIAVAELRFEYEQRISDLNAEAEQKLGSLLALTERLKREMEEAQRTSDKYKGTVAHLKEQIREVLINRDDLEHELQAERDFSAELNMIVNQIKGTKRDAILPPRRGAASPARF